MKKKILVVQFRHETNSFSIIPADEKAYRNFRFDVGEEVFPAQRGIRNEMGAFLDVLGDRDEFELIPTVALAATPSGPVTADVYDFVLNEIRNVVDTHAPFDGVLLNCHGAMVAKGHDDGEGDLFEFIRNLVGWDIPLISTLDLHANVTVKMAKCATALVPYECYPHTDAYETAVVAAHLMADTLLNKIKPVMTYRRIPFLCPLLFDKSPQISPIYEFIKRINSHPDVLSLRFTHGFFSADIEEMGMAVLSITNDNRALSEKLADELVLFIEDNSANLKNTYITLDEALDIAVNSSKSPVVLADASDNPGAGGVGDTTHILRSILKRGITGAAIATITDPSSVEKCIKAGVGAKVALKLGGWTDPEYSGGPVDVTAYVKMITDGKYMVKGDMMQGTIVNHGTTVVAEIAGNTVLISSIAFQPIDLEVFRSHGIVPEEQKILVTKSAVHYRASYGTVASEMFTLSLPGYSVPVPQAYKYKKWKGKV